MITNQTDIEITPLSVANIGQAFCAAKRIFPKYITDIRLAYIYSLLPKALMRAASPLAASIKMEQLDYFLASKPGTHEVVGITGLYVMKGKSEAWIGWYGVDPDARGKKYGSKLLEWSIEEAKRRGYDTVRLWATVDEQSKPAHQMYEKRGFIAQDAGLDQNDHGAKIIIYSLDLKGRTTQPFHGSLREAMQRGAYGISGSHFSL